MFFFNNFFYVQGARGPPGPTGPQGPMGRAGPPVRIKCSSWKLVYECLGQVRFAVIILICF